MCQQTMSQVIYSKMGLKSIFILCIWHKHYSSWKDFILYTIYKKIKLIHMTSVLNSFMDYFHHTYCNLTFILLTWSTGWAPNNASKWQMGFNLAFKGLTVFWGQDLSLSLGLQAWRWGTIMLPKQSVKFQYIRWEKSINLKSSHIIHNCQNATQQ